MQLLSVLEFSLQHEGALQLLTRVTVLGLRRHFPDNVPPQGADEDVRVVLNTAAPAGRGLCREIDASFVAWSFVCDSVYLGLGLLLNPLRLALYSLIITHNSLPSLLTLLTNPRSRWWRD